MPRLDLNKVTALVHSEIAEASLRHGLADEYCCWCVLRTLGKRLGGAEGRIDLDDAVHNASLILGLSKRSIQRKLADGERFFWRVRGHDVYLMSIMKVVQQLELDRVAADRFVVPLSHFSGTNGDRKGLLLSLVASRDPGSPVSVAGLAERCGMSERSVQRLLASQPFSERETNYEIVGETRDLAEAKRMVSDDPAKFIKRVRGTDAIMILRRMPNSYRGKHDRKPLMRERKRFLDALGDSGVVRSRMYRRKMDDAGSVAEMGWAELGSDIGTRMNGPKVKVWRRDG